MEQEKGFANLDLDSQYNIIYRYFKTTTEDYDDLDWDGQKLDVYYENKIIETYSINDLISIFF